MSIIEKFVGLFGVPDFVVPYLSCFVSEVEMDLVVRLEGQKCSVTEVAKRMGCASEQAQGLLEGCYLKHIVHREEIDGEIVYFGADFYGRLDFMCKFDDSYKLEIRSLMANNIDKDIDKDKDKDKDKDNNDNDDNNDNNEENINNDDNENNEKVKDDGGDFLRALDEWCYQVYAERMEPYLEQLKNKEAVDRAPETFFMIDELEELLNSVKDIRLVPCNCRKLAEGCEKPTETCLSFDASITDRTYGRSLSKDEAREIVKLSHRKGLMHQINSDWREKGPTWMCNCCSCCCYPTRLAQDRGMKGIFPVVQYLAQRNEVQCSHCGACVKRCNFSAFQLGESEIMVNGKPRKKVEFDQDKCWGCGICVDSCVTKAISLASLG